MLYIGVHTVDNGGIDMAARRAAKGGARSLQIFTTIPKYYGDKSSIRPERIERFRTALADVGIAPAYVMAHAAYVLNMATDDAEKYSRATAGIKKELERSTAVGLGSVCFHPGAATTGGSDGPERVARAMTAALEAVPGATRLLVENTAGAGRTVGRTPEEVAAILKDIPKAHRKRAGYGLDTCHLFASGLDITKSKGALTDILDSFQDAIGEPPSFFHLNDSEGALGSNRDRHMLIGEGQIGIEPFRWLLHDPRAQNIPLILETPEINVDVADDDASPDPYDKRMIELLNSLV